MKRVEGGSSRAEIAARNLWGVAARTRWGVEAGDLDESDGEYDE